MVKKSKARTPDPSQGHPAEVAGSGKKRAAKRAGRKQKSLLAAAAGAGELAKPKKALGGKKRASGHLALSVPLSKARKLAGDLYQTAGLAFWAEAIEKSPAAERETLIQLQDSICDAADLLKEARSANPRRLHLYWVASFDRDGLPASPPRFVTAAGEAEALVLFKAKFMDEIGRRKPRAQLVPHLAEDSQLHG
jgi:hypothetical protein